MFAALNCRHRFFFKFDSCPSNWLEFF